MKKGFPFSAFSKESNMNEDFSVLAFPTFVLINSEGEVSQVVSGYTAEVREMLFGEGG
jgi:thioredoxin-related protein